MIAALRMHWERLRAAIEKLTPRERGAIAVLAALILIYGASLAFDWSDRARAAAGEALGGQRAFTRTDFAAEGAAIDAEAGHVRDWSIRAPTAPIARVRAMTDLETMAREAGVGGMRLTADREEESEGALRFMTIEMDAAYDESAFLDFLRLISGATESMTPVTIDVETRGAPRFRMAVRIPYLIEAPPS